MSNKNLQNCGTIIWATFWGDDCEKFSLHLDTYTILVLRIMCCVNAKKEWSVISVTVRGSNAVNIYPYVKIMATFLDLMFLKDSTVVH
jgi:hypothetical protein